MIVRITGHSKGIGKCLYNDLIQSGHDVQGFSRSNGFDISIAESRQSILEQSKHADIFINCAWPDGDLPMTEIDQFNGQTEMLKLMINVWEGDKDKKILNSLKGTKMNVILNNHIREDIGNFGSSEFIIKSFKYTKLNKLKRI
jgi:REP element-mobilizing transposase RayT